MTSRKNSINYKDSVKKYIDDKLKQVDESFKLNWAEMYEELEPFMDSVDLLGDRELAIISASLLDDYLEVIITDSYIKNKKVKSIFKDEHILQSFYAKINIAYFSGLIPEWLYHDLKLICEIRNKFAHKFLTGLNFNAETITRKIDKCELRPKTLDSVKAPRLKFLIVVILSASVLKGIKAIISYSKPPNLVDICNMNKWNYEQMALTKDEIKEIAIKIPHK